MSTDTTTQPTVEPDETVHVITSDTEADASASAGRVAFEDLPFREQTRIMGLLNAFKSQVFDYEKELKAVYGAALFDMFEQLGTPSAAAAFGDGKVQFTAKKNDPSFKVTDREAFAEWVEENHPTEGTHEFVVRDGFEKALLKQLAVVDDQIVHTKTGEFVEGVTYVEGGHDRSNGFSVHWSDRAAKSAALAEVAASLVADVMPALTAGGGE